MAEEDDVMADGDNEEGFETEDDGPTEERAANSQNWLMIGGIGIGVVVLLGICALIFWAISAANGNNTATIDVALTATVEFIETSNAQVVAVMTADAATQAAFVESTPTPEGGAASATPGEIAAVTTEAPTGGETPTPVIPPSATNTPLFSPTPDGAVATETPLGGAETETPNPNPATDTPAAASASETPAPSGSATRVPIGTRTPTPLGGATSAPGTPETAVAVVSGTPGTPRATNTRNPLASATPGLPNTGFADDIGLPSLILAALALIMVIVIVRRLRLSPR